MKDKIEKHIGYYFSLFTIVVVGAFFAYQVSFEKQLQMLILVTTTLLYVGWGFVHHFLNHDLTTKIVVEYLLMGSLGMAIMLFFLRGGI